MNNVHVVDHPLIQDKLAKMRDKNTPPSVFRSMLKDISMLMTCELTRNFETQLVEIETPICKTKCPVLKEKFITIVPIIRAGIGLLNGIFDILPNAHVGFLGLERDEETHMPREYYCKMPPNVQDSLVIIVDPMLATGGSTNHAIDVLKARGCKRMISMNIVAAPVGIESVQQKHPDVEIWVAAIDEGLNEDAYIVPGLGDAGDRVYYTVQ